MAAGWSLQNIEAKVRSITGRPSEDQLSNQEVTDYINNYYVYMMPFELKEQIENQYLQFKTTPGKDVYVFPEGYFTDSPGAYADGFPLVFYQDPDIFFQDWPQQYAVDNIATGNASQITFTGGLQNPPVVIGSLFITSDDPLTNEQQVVQDQGNIVNQQISTGTGINTYNGILTVFQIQPGTLSITDGVETFTDGGTGSLVGSLGGRGTIVYSTGVWSVTFNAAVIAGVGIEATYQTNLTIGTLSGDGAGTINYITGAYSVTFNSTPAASAYIYAKYIGYSGNRPQGVLWWNNQFTMRPVPDQAYNILMQGFIKPNILMLFNDTPLQVEWGQLIAYGAALDIFSSTGDLDNYERYYPIFKRMENIALGRTIQQYTASQSVPRF
jgi:hypothetical protein